MILRSPPPDAAVPPITAVNRPVDFRWHVAALLIFLLVAAALVVLFHDRSYDDAYITFRYARNLSEGQGFCFNPGIPSRGTTTPLLTLLLALAGWAGVPVPAAGSLVSILALFGLASVLYFNHVADGRPLPGLALGLMILMNFRLVLTIGGEPVLLCFLVAAACHLSEVRHRPVAAALLLALAALTRGEGVLAAPILFFLILHRRRRIPWAGSLVYLLVLGSWLAYSRLVLGGFAPSTLEAKVAQGASGLFIGFWQQFWVWAGRSATLNPAWYLLLLLTIPGAYRLLCRRRSAPGRAWLAFLLWVAAYLAGYSALGVAGYHWYSTPVVVGLLIIVSAGLPDTVSFRGRSDLAPWTGKAVQAVCLLLLAGFLAGECRAVLQHHRHLNYRDELYPLAAARLNTLAGGDSSVAHLEIGYLGYHYQGQTLDLLGLTGDIDLQQIARGNLLWGLMNLAPDYLVLMENFGFMTNFVSEEPWFPRVYQQVDRIAAPGFPGRPLEIYARRPGESMPPSLGIEIRQLEGDRVLRPGETDRSIGQTFRCAEDGLTRIDLLLGPEDRFPEPQGSIFQLFDEDSGGRELVRIALPPGRLRGRHRFYPVRLGEILPSAGRRFRLCISRAGSTPLLPALQASEADTYPGGSLQHNGEPAGGDLVFRTWYAQR